MTPRFAGLSCEAKLLYIGALNFVDDWGRHPADPMALRLAIFPGAAMDVGPLSDELTAAGLWGIYSTDAGRFVQVLGFLRHQRVDRRQPARWPEPTTDNSEQDVPARWRLFFADLLALKKKKGIADDSPDDSTNDRRMIDERSTNGRAKSCRKGRERKGKERIRERTREGKGRSPPWSFFRLDAKGRKNYPRNSFPNCARNTANRKRSQNWNDWETGYKATKTGSGRKIWNRGSWKSFGPTGTSSAPAEGRRRWLIQQRCENFSTGAQRDQLRSKIGDRGYAYKIPRVGGLGKQPIEPPRPDARGLCRRYKTSGAGRCARRN